MKRSGKITFLFISLAVIGLFLGCELPDYQLAFEIGNYAYNGYTVSVPYSIENIGWKDMDNAQIRISVVTDSAYSPYHGWTTGVNLSIGNRSQGVLDIDYSGTISDVYVSAAGWDED